MKPTTKPLLGRDTSSYKHHCLNSLGNASQVHFILKLVLNYWKEHIGTTNSEFMIYIHSEEHIGKRVKVLP